MRTLARMAFLILWTMAPSFASAANAPDAETSCPVNLALNFEEREAMRMFYARLSHMDGFYGTPQFQTRLNQILSEQFPTARVIDVGPSFMERVLNQVDQQYMKDLIAKTIGLEHPDWREFERVMKTVTLFDGLVENKYGKFTDTGKRLLAAIQAVRYSASPYTTTPAEREKGAKRLEVTKARALTLLANLAVYMERWSVINYAIAQQRADAEFKAFGLKSIVLISGGLALGSLLVSGPLVAGAGAFAASFASDAIVAANLFRLGQVAGGVALGATGFPIGTVMLDSSNALMNGGRLSLNNHTVYACELDKQFREWRQRGVSPYLNAALIGGGTGMFGLLTMSSVGAMIVKHATTYGSRVALLYSLYRLNDSFMMSLAEHRLAIESLEKGNKDEALQHLQRSRQYAQNSGSQALETILIGALNISLTQSLRHALHSSEDAILKMFADSTDTFPRVVEISKELAEKAIGSRAN